MIFVDDNGRVYQNWKSFKKNNVMLVGLIIAPERGIYMSDEDSVRYSFDPLITLNKFLFLRLN